MKLIACAILSVGLCVNGTYSKYKGIHVDYGESLIAVVAALIVIFG